MPTAGSLLLTLLATFVSHGLASNGLANPVPRATLRGRREAAPAPTAAPLIKRNWEELIVTGGHTCAWFQGYESWVPQKCPSPEYCETVGSASIIQCCTAVDCDVQTTCIASTDLDPTMTESVPGILTCNEPGYKECVTGVYADPTLNGYSILLCDSTSSNFAVYASDPNVKSTPTRPTSSSSSSSSSSFLFSSSTIPAPGPTTTAPTPSKSSPPLGAIVGGAVGGVAVLILLAILAVLLFRRKRRNQPEQPPMSSNSPMDQTNHMSPVGQHSAQMSPVDRNSQMSPVGWNNWGGSDQDSNVAKSPTLQTSTIYQQNTGPFHQDHNMNDVQHLQNQQVPIHEVPSERMDTDPHEMG